VRIPPGWDSWMGLFGNSQYYNYSISLNGIEVHHNDSYYDDYFTDLIANNTLKFINETLTTSPNKPFLTVAAFPAPHDPRTCAPQYCDSYLQEIAPRTPNWNILGEDKHWLATKEAAYAPNNEGFYTCDTALQKRWQTLLSVDDHVKSVVDLLKQRGALNNTYFFYTSDHGYNLCTFRFMDKRQPYENDLRIPLLVMGPGIKTGVKLNDVVLNIDLAPTFIELMGLKPPTQMDGQSYASVLLGKQSTVFRKDFLVDYHGEFNASCNLSNCPPPAPNSFHENDCRNNTYQCVRHLDLTSTNQTNNNYIYCEFVDDLNFTEYYNINSDPYQLNNTAKSLDAATRTALHNRLVQLATCSGPSCRTVPSDSMI